MKPEPRAVDFFIHEDLIFWSFRYFLGRQTISTVDFAERLARAFPRLETHVKHLIKAELEDAFIRDDEDRQLGKTWKHLGMDCDREAWEKVRKAYGGGQ